MHPNVVNIYKTKKFDVFIGRYPSGLHWGNPFTHLYSSAASVRVASREEAIRCFRIWMKGTEHQDVEPARRAWMLEHLHELRGKTLGCFCAPKDCHGEVLIELLEASNESIQI